jgi:four helix bundle protein
MNKHENLKDRTKSFALRIIRLCSALPKKTEAQILARQIFRSGTSVGAQFRESLRAKSDADLINKLEGCLQELEETQYWLELIMDCDFLNAKRVTPLYNESNELMAIFVSSVKRIKSRYSRKA